MFIRLARFSARGTMRRIGDGIGPDSLPVSGAFDAAAVSFVGR
jgi:hypothetical protein